MLQYIKLPSNHLPVWIKFKASTSSCRKMNCFPLYNTVPHMQNVASFSLVYHHFMTNVLTSYILPVLTFAAKTSHDMYIGTNQHHSLCIWLVRRKYHLDSFSQELLSRWTNTQHVFPIIIILMSSSLGLTIIPHKLHLFFLCS